MYRNINYLSPTTFNSMFIKISKLDLNIGSKDNWYMIIDICIETIFFFKLNNNSQCIKKSMAWSLRGSFLNQSINLLAANTNFCVKKKITD